MKKIKLDAETLAERTRGGMGRSLTAMQANGGGATCCMLHAKMHGPSTDSHSLFFSFLFFLFFLLLFIPCIIRIPVFRFFFFVELYATVNPSTLNRNSDSPAFTFSLAQDGSHTYY